MIVQLIVALLFWTVFSVLAAVVALGAFAMYRTLMGWLTGQEWIP
jgi:hypothetical protein